MAHHLEAIAAHEHGEDRAHLTQMCAALQLSLGRAGGDAGRAAGDEGRGPIDGEVAAAIDRSLTSLRDDLDSRRVDREGARVRLRRLVALAGAVRGGDHAQSPASDPSHPADDADPWDYRRDRHRDGDGWERRWVECIVRPCPTGPPPRALLTSCGMAAVTTVLALIERTTGDGAIVVDRATYHETRHLLVTGALAGRVHEVASDDVADAVTALGAAAVVVDAVSNSADVRLADLDDVSRALDQVADHASRADRSDAPLPLLVVDASVCSTASAPVRRLLDRPGRAHRAVVIESLTKHAQLGLDRVAAGVIVAGGRDATLLDGLREHLGTNIADLTCLQLQAPDLTLLGARLDRVARNAELVAEHLAAAGAPVVHPSRPDHPDHARWVADRPSCGLLTLAHDDCPPDLLDRWRQRALTRQVPLDHGAGFGFDTTRVYRTSATVAEARCFVRIAPGAEPLDTMLAVAEVLASPWA